MAELTPETIRVFDVDYDEVITLAIESKETVIDLSSRNSSEYRFMLAQTPSGMRIAVIECEGSIRTTTDWQGQQPRSSQEIEDYEWVDVTPPSD